MNERNISAAPAETMTRRQAIAGLAAVFGGLAAGPSARGREQPQPPIEVEGRSRTSLHYEADFNGGAQRVYDTLLDSKLFAAFSGAPADIDPKEGGAFSMFGGLIVGRNVELVPSRRIVQAWRPTHWDPGIYSIARFELKERNSKTSLELDHTGFPEGESVSLDHGWKSHYLDRLAKFLT